MNGERLTPHVAYRAVLLAAGLLLFGLLFRQLTTLLLAVLVTIVIAIPLSASFSFSSPLRSSRRPSARRELSPARSPAAFFVRPVILSMMLMYQLVPRSWRPKRLYRPLGDQ